ncbi:MAG: M23 family metallopeptidase [Bacteroidetes bacterium]|nr:MAG: M23 family metallopeptidase [Bacteroidota bacterium]
MCKKLKPRSLVLTTLVAVLFGCNGLWAQTYPQQYFRFPVNIPVQLAANFGEVRMNHFHMGLDIRTQGRENIPVVAAADGYITRISVANNGYGRAIYIQHANGYTTVYGHVNKFYPELEKALRDTQFARKKWQQDIVLPPYAFPINKGDFIAYSGNTGSSGGPHVHFEIRNTLTEECINPLLFGLDIPDAVAPVIQKLFWYSNSQSIYQQTAQNITLKKQGNHYTAQLTVAEPSLYLALQTEDKTSNSPFYFGVYKVNWQIDGQPLNEFSLQKMNYADARAVNGCIDYAKFLYTNVPVQILKKLPGMQLPIFSMPAQTGAIVLNDTLPHTVTVQVQDFKGNTATLEVLVKYTGQPTETPKNTTFWQPNQVNTAAVAGAKLLLPSPTLYDAVLPAFNYVGTTADKTVWQVLQPNIPAHAKYTVQLPVTALQKSYAQKLVVTLQSNIYFDAQKPTWVGSLAEAQFNRFGTIALGVDTIPPQINWVRLKPNQRVKKPQELACTITDANKTITQANAYLNGEWILLEHITNRYTIYPGTQLLPGTNVLEIVATDIVGNTATKTITFLTP